MVNFPVHRFVHYLILCITAKQSSKTGQSNWYEFFSNLPQSVKQNIYKLSSPKFFLELQYVEQAAAALANVGEIDDIDILQTDEETLLNVTGTVFGKLAAK